MYVTRSFTCFHWKGRKKETQVRRRCVSMQTTTIAKCLIFSQHKTLWSGCYTIVRSYACHGHRKPLVWFSASTVCFFFYFSLLLRLTDIRRQRNTIISFLSLVFVVIFFLIFTFAARWKWIFEYLIKFCIS